MGGARRKWQAALFAGFLAHLWHSTRRVTAAGTTGVMRRVFTTGDGGWGIRRCDAIGVMRDARQG